MLFAEQKLRKSGENIRNLIENADQSTPDKSNKITELLEKHFGSPDNPNEELIPNAPAGEMQKIKSILRHEIITQGRGSLSDISFKKLQDFKTGSANKGSYDKSITNSQQSLYRNISRAYGKVLREAVPGLGDEYDKYAKASNAISQQGEGIVNALAHHYNQLPFFAKYLVARQLYNGLDNINSIIKPQYKPGIQNTSVQSFQGY